MRSPLDRRLPKLKWISLEVQLTPGNFLTLYTDGVTEATNAEGDEFGESRLIQSLLAHRDPRLRFCWK